MSRYKKIFFLAFISSSIFLFSGCNSLKIAINTVISPFQSETTLPKDIIVTLSGTIQKEESLFTSYTFTSENSEIFSLNTTEKFSQNLDNYKNKNVVITGILSNFVANEETKTVTFEKNISLIDIAYFKKNNKNITNDENQWTIFTPQYFTIAFYRPLIHFEITEKILTEADSIETISKIITKYNNDIFFTVTKNIDKGWQKKFQTEGDDIRLGKWTAYRLFSGKQILFYLPELDIQIDYWGDVKDIHLFYSIIKTLENSIENNKNTEKNSEKKNKQNKQSNQEEEEVVVENNNNKKINSKISQPSISVIVKKILENPSQHLEKSNQYHNRILVDKIEYFGNFLSIEYKILTKDPYESVLKAERKKKLFSIEWRSIFYEEFYLQKIVEWKKGKEYVWEIIDGNIPNIEMYAPYFLRNIATKYITKIPDNFLILLSPSYKYSITYPQKMYYDIFTDNDTIEGVKWSNAPFSSDEKNHIFPDITLQLKKGNIDTYTEKFSDNSILIPKSESAHFILTGNKNTSFSVLQKMAKSIVLY